MNILCKLGFHKWEKDPSHKEYVKYTFNMSILSIGHQHGTRICERHCGVMQKVIRKGYSGMFGGGYQSEWKPVK